MHILLRALIYGILVFSKLDAFVPNSILDLSFGYRRDRLESERTFHNPKDNPAKGFGDLEVKKMRIAEIGLNCTFAPAEDRTFNSWWLNQFYLRSSAYVGCSHQGNWQETLGVLLPTPTQPIIEIGKAYQCRTYDFDLGIGWLYPICEDFGIGPTFGLSYDYLKVRIRNLKNACSSPDSNPSRSNGESFRSRFQGLWVGADMYYAEGNWEFSAGYEYHFISHWKAAFRIPSKAASARSRLADDRMAHEGYGNVFFLKEQWTFCDCWNAGLGVKYRSYRAKDGSEVPVGGFLANGLPSTEFHRAKASWDSVEIHLDLGVNF